MTPAHRHHSGFTLVELMFSMAIGSIILILAASMLGTSGNSYERVGGTVSSEREARAAINQISADFSTAQFHKAMVISPSTATWPVDSFGFLSLQPSQAQSVSGRIGDLCAVNYYVKDLQVGGKTLRCLMRGFRESKDTFDGLLNDSIPSLFLAKPDLDEPVAFGVVSFEARPKSIDAMGNQIDWVKNDVNGPDLFELKLVVARRTLVSRLKQTSDWDGSGSAENLLGTPAKVDRNPNLEVYETTVRFGSHEKS